MYILRCKYVRGEEVKYISHLDLMRVFERAIRRADIPIDFSAGFNPRPKIVFALPLPVGVTSDGEYGDFTFSTKVAPGEFIAEINPQLPEGLKVISAKEHEDKGSVMAEVCGAVYELTAAVDAAREPVRGEVTSATPSICEVTAVTSLICEDNSAMPSIGEGNSAMPSIGEVTAAVSYTDTAAVSCNAVTSAAKIIAAMLGKSEIIVEKKTEDGSKMINIRPMIKKLEIHEPVENECNTIYNGNNLLILKITAEVSAGSRENLRPDLVAAALEEFSGGAIKIERIHRKELLLNNG